MKNQAFWSWHDGKFTKSPVVSAMAGGFLHGYGLFETLYYKEGRLFQWKAHLERLRNHCISYGLATPEGKLYEVAQELCKKNSLEEARVRISLSATGTDYGQQEIPSTVLIQVLPYKREDREYRLKPYYASQFGCSLSQHKSLSYSGHILSKQQALKDGGDEALLLDFKGAMVECSSANIVLYKEGQWYTPSLKHHGLHGIQLQTFKKVLVENGLSLTINSTLENEWEFALICNSLIGVQPVISIGEQMFNTPFLNDFYMLKDLLERHEL